MLRNNFEGETMIFRNANGFYSTSLGKKNLNDEWQNKFLSVQFPKGTDIPDKTKINIKKAFLSFDSWTDKDGNNRSEFKLVVQEFENPNAIEKPQEDETFGSVDDTESPF